MALFPGGSVWGYREYVITGGRRPAIVPRAHPSPPKLNSLMVQTLGIPSYDYSVRSGEVTSGDFPTAWTTLPWRCRYVRWMIHGGPIEAQLSFDGIVVQETSQIVAPIMTLAAFQAFRVRLLVSGFLSSYQLIAFL